MIRGVRVSVKSASTLWMQIDVRLSLIRYRIEILNEWDTLCRYLRINMLGERIRHVEEVVCGMSGQNRLSSDCAIRPASEAKRNYLYSVAGFFACLCYFWVALPGAYGSTRLKTDVVVMKNGDKMTCEIRSLGQGQRRLSRVMPIRR